MYIILFKNGYRLVTPTTVSSSNVPVDYKDIKRVGVYPEDFTSIKS